MEELIALIREVIAEIYGEVEGVETITNETEKERLFNVIKARMDDLSSHVDEVIPERIIDEYEQGFSTAGKQVEALGIGTVAGSLKDQVHLEAIQELALDTADDLQASFRTAYLQAMGNIQNEIKRTQDLIAKGILIGNEDRLITARVKKSFYELGLTSFVTRDGKRLPLDFYASTVVRTKQKQAHVKASINRYQQNSISLVQVSKHGATCKECAKREGLILSLTGEHEGVPTADEAGLPPYHPNCRHSIRPVTSLEFISHYVQIKLLKRKRKQSTAIHLYPTTFK